MPFRDMGRIKQEQVVTDLKNALRQVDLLTQERDHSLTRLITQQSSALEDVAAQAHLMDLIEQRDVLIGNQQEQLHALQQRVHDLEEEARASHAATLYCHVEASTAIKELQIAAEELEATNQCLQA